MSKMYNNGTKALEFECEDFEDDEDLDIVAFISTFSAS